MFSVQQKPGPGDLSLCMKCGEILLFGEDMRLAAPDISQLMKLHPTTAKELAFVQGVIRRERVLG